MVATSSTGPRLARRGAAPGREAWTLMSTIQSSNVITTKRLIVNADDFGRSFGINRGILTAHVRGIVTSASLMVRWDAAVEAAEIAREYSRLDLGLHFDAGEWVYRDGTWTPVYTVVDLTDPDG